MNYVIISILLVLQGSVGQQLFKIPILDPLLGNLQITPRSDLEIQISLPIIDQCAATPPTVNQTSVAVEYHAWSRSLNASTPQYYKLEYGNKAQMENFKNIKIFVVYFHGIGENAKQEWILQSKDISLNTGRYHFRTIISLDYKNFVCTKNQAIQFIEFISKDVAKFLNWTLSEISDARFIFTGFGMGAYIAGRTSELLQEHYTYQTVNQFYALDPDTPVNSSLFNQQVQITPSQASIVWVIHTSTCSRSPQIQACDSNSRNTMGYIDFFPNGGAAQPGCGSNSSCSKFRATELYRDGLQKLFESKVNYFYAWPCPNFENFEAGLCTDCGFPICIDLLGNATVGTSGRYFFYTNEKLPFGRGSNQTKPQ